MLAAILGRSGTKSLFEFTGKLALVWNADLNGDLIDAAECCFQQVPRPLHPQVGKVFEWSHANESPEQLDKVRLRDIDGQRHFRH